MKDKTASPIIRIFFVLNAAFLIWAILWKCGAPFIGDSAQRVINLIPFQGNTAWEMQFNVLLFVPFGFLLSAVWRKSFLRKLLFVASASVLLEIAQYVLAVGRSDITDVLLNTLGGAVGILGCSLLVKLFGRHSRKALVLCGVCIIAFEVYASVSFLLFGMVRLGFMTFRI